MFERAMLRPWLFPTPSGAEHEAIKQALGEGGGFDSQALRDKALKLAAQYFAMQAIRKMLDAMQREIE